MDTPVDNFVDKSVDNSAHHFSIEEPATCRICGIGCDLLERGERGSTWLQYWQCPNCQHIGRMRNVSRPDKPAGYTLREIRGRVQMRCDQEKRDERERAEKERRQFARD